MTTTLMLSFLLGAAASYPLLTKTATLEEETTTQIKGILDKIAIPLAVATLALPLFLYGNFFAVVVLIGAIVAGLFPRLALAILSFPFLAGIFSVEVWVLIVIPIVALFHHLTNSDIRWSFRRFSWVNVALFAGATILVLETLLWSAASGFYPNTAPKLVASIGGERAIPILADSLKLPVASSQAKRELLEFGEPVVPTLVSRINSYDQWTRREAAEIIVTLGAADQMAGYGENGIVVLVNALTSTNELEMNGYRLEWKDKIGISDLAKKHLENIGKPAIPHLLHILGNRGLGEYSHANILNTIRRIGGQEILSEVLPIFINWESDGDNSYVTIALAAWGKPAIPQFMAALEYDDEWLRWWSKEALVHIGEAAVPHLIKKIKIKPGPQQYELGQAEAIIALGSLKEDSAVPLLIEKLNHPTLRTHAVWALGAIGDRRASDPIVRLNRKNPTKQNLEVLGQIGGDTAEQYLKEVLRYGEYDFRRDALKVMRERFWKSGDVAAIPQLINEIQTSDQDVIQSAAYKLGELGEPSILTFLEDIPVSDHPVDESNCSICYAIKKLKAIEHAQ